MELVFTTSSLLDLLTQIEELKDFQIDLDESSNGTVKLTIGDSVYEINPKDATEVRVEEETLEQVEEINEEGFDNLPDDIDVTDAEPVESGVLKELLKSLALGGMIRLSAKLLSNK